MAAQLSRKHVVEAPTIPDRLYFKIGDVARICEVETYVLRFWETQFPQLKPNKSGTGQRLYRRRDVELALEIKRLAHGEGYTLSGVRQALGQAAREGKSQASQRLPAVNSGKRIDAVTAAVGRARAELREIAGLLSAPAVPPQRRRSRMATLPIAAGLPFPQ
ncbi:MAG: MerR family transcriptional regulator [Terracidiphilus sp.]